MGGTRAERVRRARARQSRTRFAIGVAVAGLTGAAAIGTSVASPAPSSPVRTVDVAATPADLHTQEDAAVASAQPSVRARALPVDDPSPDAIGQWALPVKDRTGVVGISAVLLRTGKVLLWGPYQVPAGNGTYEVQTRASVWDPVTHKSVRIDPPEDMNVFCGGATILGDGTVLAVGGLDPYYGFWGSHGNPAVVLFDPITQTWSQAPPMFAARWYPTVTELADGSAIAVGGRDINAKPNNTLEHFNEGPNVVPTVVGTWKLNAQEDLYPNQFLLPNGQVFSFEGDRTDYLDPTTWRINGGPVPLAPQFSYPNAVVLPIIPGGDIQMVVYGGKTKFAGATVNVSTKIDLSSTTPTFTALTPMPQSRTDMNSVLLPDGTIFVAGGNELNQFDNYDLQSLLYDPATDTWTPMASQSYRRAYHSTAILLPDGTVLSAGDNGPPPAGGRNNLEVYSPPYLFKGPRPAIVSAPTAATVGSPIDVSTNEPINKVVLISPGATTHATNMHQRMIELATAPLASGDPNGLTATIPADGTVPPGPYMVFALDANNIPSIATWIMVS